MKPFTLEGPGAENADFGLRSLDLVVSKILALASAPPTGPVTEPEIFVERPDGWIVTQQRTLR